MAVELIPAPQQIADWVSEIEPEEPLERHVSMPGVLLLRVKSPRCQYQGMHLGLSRAARREIEARAEVLQARHDRNSFTLRGSYPEGRAWFHLFTSGLDIGPWTRLTVSLEGDLDVPAEMEWQDLDAALKLSASGRATFCRALRETSGAPLRVDLPLRRLVKPESEPHSLWIWEWEPRSLSD